ncbi:3-hydroxyacyl-CoA dehydratase 4, transcript variant X3 [Ictidomys tridecemlineatus]|nr:3-hydroxyacyl-CoA dehydratase 4, transcript variant X3 [Ictidomys tridecemlineatus]
MTVRFFSFGKDSMVDTFYAIGLVMRLCQSISLLELLHIYVGIESNHLFPRFLQLTERIVILFVVITSQEEIQEKYVVCVLFIFWNLLDMARYTYSMLSVIGTYYSVLTWLSQTLWMPIYPLCVLAEAFAIYQSLPYFESFGTYSTKLPFDFSIYFPYVLRLYLMMLFIGKCRLFCFMNYSCVFWFTLPSTLIDKLVKIEKTKGEAQHNELDHVIKALGSYNAFFRAP